MPGWKNLLVETTKNVYGYNTPGIGRLCGLRLTF